ncbi:Na+/H+ antiporter subunit E [Azospirillum halopraeferens]|uniref:Na+/H+ antiporter subunit E n=1 Tax=Azospirillum halopraeferens TaxID=34010 RepID=UPI00041BC728|nr:Na+/H+ antiporter subunit E [Azospirillum halopraeferens]
MTDSARDHRRVPRGRLVGRHTAPAVAVRIGLFALLWVVLTGRPADSWAYGLLAVALAVPASLVLVPPRRTRLRVLRFAILLPMLAWVSIRGGVDVAWRAFTPRPAIDPGVLTYRLRSGRADVGVALGFAATMIPGSLVMDVQDDGLRIHVIDRTLPNEAMLARMEDWIAWALPDADTAP